MTTNIFAFSDKGCILAKKIADYYSGAVCFSIPKFAQKYDMQAITSTKAKVGEIFDHSQLIIFVGAVGIAVRNIAPFIKSKTTDPAVLAVDEKAQFVIPLLSGHIGGANSLSKQLAEKLGGVAVITTATDINCRFSVDDWAAKNGLHISHMEKAKEISAAILVSDVTIKSDFTIKGDLPQGVTIQGDLPQGVTIQDDKAIFEITYKTGEGDKKNCNLRLVPKVLSVGMGCKRNTPISAVEKLFLKVLKENNLDVNAVKSIASIDIKKDEQAIISLASKYKLPFVTYTALELLKLEGEFTKSDFVKGVVGVDNVCERSAMLASQGLNKNPTESGKLLVKKTVLEGVTIAIAITNWEVEF